MVPGAVLIPVGLLWYGWSAQTRLHWIMPDVGAGCGIILSMQAMQAYMLGWYSRYTASASAVSQLLRSILIGLCVPSVCTEPLQVSWLRKGE